MNAITAMVQNGRLDLKTPADWPEGCPVIIEPLTKPPARVGLDETEWRDDAASLADWDRWIQTIEPLEFTADEIEAFARFQEEMRRCNIEAVRRQMEAGQVP